MSTNTGSLHVEFHANQRKASQHRVHAAAHIRHCLVRLEGPDDIQILIDAQPKLCEYLGQITQLETIVLETRTSQHQVNLEEGKIQSLLDHLRETGRAAVRQRTCEVADRNALQAKTSRSARPSDSILSPFWCLEEHASDRKNW